MNGVDIYLVDTDLYFLPLKSHSSAFHHDLWPDEMVQWKYILEYE